MHAVRILSLDGGGVRGFLAALVLAEIEARAGEPVAELFDFVAGTSTGGMIACALAVPGADGRPRYTAAEVAARYESDGPRIFRRGALKRISSAEGFADERYEDDGLVAALVGTLGETWLSEALVPLLITAYDIEARAATFLRSERAKVDPTADFRLADAARATSAAPTYFEPARVTDRAEHRTRALIDGGVFAVNPALCAYVEVAHGEGAAAVSVLASLGTGSATRRIEYDHARWWGQLQWAQPLLDVVLDGVGDTTDFHLTALLGPRYVRLQTRLDRASDDLDDASPENLDRLREEAEALIAARSDDLDRLCETLTAPQAIAEGSDRSRA